MNNKSINTMINEMNIRKRSKEGRYEGRLTLNGKRKSFYGTTKAEVKQQAREYLEKIENGYKEPKRMTFNDYAKYWLVTYKKGSIEATSYTRLYRVYNNHLRDTIGKMNIGSITMGDIQKLLNEYARPTTPDTMSLAESGLKKIMQFLNPCFKKAILEGIIYSNPCEGVEMPKRNNIIKKTKVTFSLDETEMDKLRSGALEQYKTTNEYRCRNGLVLLLILNLGLRAGEALALTWDDIDFQNKVVHIRRTLQRGVKNEAVEGNAYIDILSDSTKTIAGDRVLSLNETVLFYLNELKRYDERKHISSSFVCCNKYGQVSSHKNLQKTLDTISEKMGLRDDITLHILRHTFGSELIRKGVTIAVVSKLMGHANISVTYNKYIHTIKEEEAKAMETKVIC